MNILDTRDRSATESVAKTLAARRKVHNLMIVDNASSRKIAVAATKLSTLRNRTTAALTALRPQ